MYVMLSFIKIDRDNLCCNPEKYVEICGNVLKLILLFVSNNI